MFSDVTASLENHQYPKKKAIEIDESMQLHHYDIDYYNLRLNALESFEEGEFTLSKRLKFVRKYINDSVDTAMLTHFTTIKDMTIEQDSSG